MNDIHFSSSFIFRTMTLDTFNYTDNRAGAPSHYFAYMISGNCKIVTDSDTIEIKENELFYIPNECRYRSYWYGNPKIKFISLGFSYLPNFDKKHYNVQTVPYDAETKSFMMHLSSAKNPTAADIGIFYTLVGKLIPSMSPAPVCRSREITDKAHEYMIQNLAADNSDIAKHCAISEAALYTAFKKSLGITPNTLRNRLILEKAKNILISSDKTIECISNSLGFSSTSYFRKKFKAYFGITPREMRKQNRI